MKKSLGKKSDFLKSFYGKPERKKVKKSLPNPAEIYRKYRFTFWFWLSLGAALIVSGMLIKTMPLFGFFAFALLFILFIGFYAGTCFDKCDRNDTCYGNSCLFFIWPCITWAIYCGCGLLFVKQDLVNQHLFGLIIGVVACTVFTLLIPLINYGLKLNVPSPSSNREEGDDLKPSSNDQRLIGKLIFFVAVTLSVYSALFFCFEHSELKSKKQDILFEQQPIVEILNKEFVVRDKWYDKGVYALIETEKGVFAVEVQYHPDICSATKVKILPSNSVTSIKGKDYSDFDRIEFETPASD